MKENGSGYPRWWSLVVVAVVITVVGVVVAAADMMEGIRDEKEGKENGL